MPRLTRLSRSVEGKVALVTGAASGMGRATAQLFADEGMRVAVSDVNEAGIESLADEIARAGGDAAAFPLDVSDRDAIARVVDDVVSRFGGLDVLVNNAGISRLAPIEHESFEAVWDTTLGVNLTAHVLLIRRALPHLRQSGEGRIVNIASTEAWGGQPFISPYTASKHGVLGLTRALAVELGRTGVTVNCVCPGPIETGMTAAIPDDAKQKFARRRVPLRRYGQPEEVAHATLGLVLPAMSYVNGAALVVDGGFSIQN